MMEDHLTLDIEAAEFIVDLSNVVRNTSLGVGVARLSRFQGLLDALRRFARDDQVLVYAVADRSLLHGAGLSGQEEAVLQRWARDGLIEVRPVADDRILEIAHLRDRMIVTDDAYKEYHRFHPWLVGDCNRFLSPYPDPRRPGAVAVRRRVIPKFPEWELSLVEEERELKDAGLRGRNAEQRRRTLLGRLWECPVRDCPLFGRPLRAIQPVARFTGRGAVCPDHRLPLADRGRAPRRAQVKVLVDGAVVTRFTLDEGRAVSVGRAPVRAGVALMSWLGAYPPTSMSRTHVELMCEADRVVVRDVSTNGTEIRRDGGLTRLSPRRWHPFSPGQEVVLHESTVLVLSGRRRYFNEADEAPPPPPSHVDPTTIEGKNGRITGSRQTRRRTRRR
ncbi:FHA domain-containing protein [Actinocorallia libanotica]|uniref:FHA domain-containing protein n=1 Tax=Actinocorallia libanotica TaxID=46162 RepID=A0ABP4CA53_9ACTN